MVPSSSRCGVHTAHANLRLLAKSPDGPLRCSSLTALPAELGRYRGLPQRLGGYITEMISRGFVYWMVVPLLMVWWHPNPSLPSARHREWHGWWQNCICFLRLAQLPKDCASGVLSWPREKPDPGGDRFSKQAYGADSGSLVQDGWTGATALLLF